MCDVHFPLTHLSLCCFQHFSCYYSRYARAHTHCEGSSRALHTLCCGSVSGFAFDGRTARDTQRHVRGVHVFDNGQVCVRCIPNHAQAWCSAQLRERSSRANYLCVHTMCSCVQPACPCWGNLCAVLRRSTNEFFPVGVTHATLQVRGSETGPRRH